MDEPQRTPHDEPDGDSAQRAETTRGLHPAVQIGWAVRAVVNAIVLGMGASLLGSTLAGRAPALPLRPLFLGLLLALALLVLGLLHARRLFVTWRWQIRADDVVARWGVVWRVSRSIPRVRVQHVDLSSGPIDRALGLVHVSLHVAGSAGPVLVIPGLTAEDAEAIREALLESATGR